MGYLRSNSANQTTREREWGGALAPAPLRLLAGWKWGVRVCVLFRGLELWKRTETGQVESRHTNEGNRMNKQAPIIMTFRVNPHTALNPNPHP